MNEPEAHSVRKFLKDRAILIGLPICDALARAVKDALSELECSGAAPITIYINSPGGTVLAAEEIIESIQRSNLDIFTYCLGLAAGSAAHILVVGDRRFAVSDAVVTFTDFHGDDFCDSTDIENVRNKVIKRTSSLLGVAASTVNQWIMAERKFSSAEMLDYAIVHQVS